MDGNISRVERVGMIQEINPQWKSTMPLKLGGVKTVTADSIKGLRKD
jgi:hypothetical protein